MSMPRFLFVLLAAGLWHPLARAAAAAPCGLGCDRKDPASAQEERAAATASVWEREIVLHVSDSDDMGWASIDNGDPNDQVWLDRSWDGGETWNDGSKLGETAIPEQN